MLLYACTIFLSAFLLFQIQPMIAKVILPWFGGSAAVWTTCMLFFQVVLLAGYLYAHLLIRRVETRRQWMLHALLLAAAVAMLPVHPDESWKPVGDENPTLRILGLLASTIGLPYFMLSTTGPLVQAWYARSHPGSVPYRLFALSNLASMLALLSYPVLIEPRLAIGMQTGTWSAVFGTFAALCAVTGYRSLRATAAARESEAEQVVRPTGAPKLLWVLLAACPSMLLLSVTQYLTQDIAPMPFLWIAPLSLYLLTFILCFDAAGWYRRNWFLAALGPAVAMMLYLIWAKADYTAPMVWEIVLLCAGFFVCGMVCHGELARLKPHPSHLTGYYLMISIGGAVGGVAVGIGAPYLLNANYELPISLALCALLAGLMVLRAGGLSRRWAAPAATAAVALAVFAGVVMRDSVRNSLHLARNFYGSLRVREVGVPGEWEAARALRHGLIEHGAQYTHPQRRRMLTNYYCGNCGIGMAMASMAAERPRKVGVIGLGVGTMAAYGRPGDEFRFYEINPLILDVAQEYFTFLKDSGSKVQVEIGDGRLLLEREEPQRFDALAVDAFSGDSVPVHLLTKEAMQLYFRHLKPEGVLGLHITNRYLNLIPVVERAAWAMDKDILVVKTEDDEEGVCYHNTWALLSRKGGFAAWKAGKTAQRPAAAPWFRLWTDDYSNLYSALM
ncbi:MAG: fused MFS/spermidine synthase [Acidobacteria bacterium]|nr:fused MFS/spermidine synthase [Acidobacteriota bacterium]